MAGEKSRGRRDDVTRDDVMAAIIKTARKRWAVLAVGIALLAMLFFLAGMIRTPGARKNPVTVIASRALAVAAAFMLVRIVLITHDDGVPVFLIEAGQGPGRLSASLGLIGKRFDVVPLSDVMAYVRDQRYMPGKGVGVVIYVVDRSGLDDALGVIEAPGGPGGFPVTLLIDESLAADAAGAAWGAPLPDGVDVGLKISPGGAGGAKQAWDDDGAIGKIGTVSGALEASTGRRPSYVMLEGGGDLTLGKVAKATGVEAFFGGAGYNRYGDRGNRIRPARITQMLAAGKSPGARLKVYASMYRGNYLSYPLWAWLDMTAPMPGGRRD